MYLIFLLKYLGYIHKHFGEIFWFILKKILMHNNLQKTIQHSDSSVFRIPEIVVVLEIETRNCENFATILRTLCIRIWIKETSWYFTYRSTFKEMPVLLLQSDGKRYFAVWLGHWAWTKKRLEKNNWLNKDIINNYIK